MINPAEMNRVHYFRDIVLEGPTPEEEAIIELQGDVEDLQHDVEELQGEVAELEVLRNPSYIFLADSYADPVTLGYEDTWLRRVISRMGIGDRCITRVKTGAGFCSYGESGETFTDMLRAIIGNIPTTTRALITDVVVGGGFNDRSYTEEEISEAVFEFNALMLDSLPNAKLTFIPMGWSSDNLARDLVYPLYTYKMRSIVSCPKSKIAGPVYAQLHTEDSFLEDEIHPSSTGAIAIADSVVNILNGGEVISTQPSVVKLGSQSIALTTINGDLVTIDFGGLQLNLEGVSNGTNDLGTVSGGNILGWTQFGHGYSVVVGATVGANPVPACIKFVRTNHEVHLYLEWPGAAITEAITIYIYPNAYTVPVVYA